MLLIHVSSDPDLLILITDSMETHDICKRCCHALIGSGGGKLDFLSAVLAVATLAGFFLSLSAAWKNAKGKFVISLIGTIVLGAFLTTTLWSNSQLKAENRLLTDPQVRATQLIEVWKIEAQRKFDFYSAGQAEGVVSAATDLMEDLKECRPGAFSEAQQRMKSARERAHQVEMGSSTDNTDRYLKVRGIWVQAALAAYQQVEGVSVTPPECGRN